MNKNQIYKIVLFCLIWFFTSNQQPFSYKWTCLPGLNQYLARINVLGQGHNIVTPVMLELEVPWSGVKHSTTEFPINNTINIFYVN